MKKDKLNELTWKYFWQQKLCEATKFFGVVLIVVFVPYLVGLLLDLSMSGRESIFGLWGGGLCVILLGLLFVLLILLILEGFRGWLKSNWKKAEKRAKKDLKVKK